MFLQVVEGLFGLFTHPLNIFAGALNGLAA